MTARSVPSLARRLRALAARFETSAFYAGEPGDPARFMHGPAASQAAREAIAFVASVLAFGSRKVFMKRIGEIASLAAGDADAWIREGRFLDVFPGDGPQRRFYRFFTFGDIGAFLSKYREILLSEGTLGAFVARRCGGTGEGAVKAIVEGFSHPGCRAVPCSMDSACKRICMFLRWMVRDNSPVDLGFWSGFVDKRTLIVPLDVHVLDQARALGLTDRSAADMKTALEITAHLREIFPEDPLKGDFALYGLGLSSSPCSSALSPAARTPGVCNPCT